MANKHNNRIVALYDEGNRFLRKITVEGAKDLVLSGRADLIDQDNRTINRRGIKIRFRRNDPRAGDKVSHMTAMTLWDMLVDRGHDPRDDAGEVRNPTQAVLTMQRAAPYHWGEHK